MKKLIYLLFFVAAGIACNNASKSVKTIGFIDIVEDATLAQAREGFMKALADSGWSESTGNIKVEFKNAQNDQNTLIQILDYFNQSNTQLLVCNTTLPTITAVKRVKNIPICMMLAPRPDIAKLSTDLESSPKNLFGVYETLSYIDTSLGLIKQVQPSVSKVGVIYNPSEPQSIEALETIKLASSRYGISLEILPVSNSSETQMVVQALLNKSIQAFFALPDNVVFASFETIAKECSAKKIAIYSSEQGLIKRGALAAYGADITQWGYQSGVEAIKFLKTGVQPKPVEVIVRNKVANKQLAEQLGLKIPAGFTIN